jgi:hypothetical protein
MPYINGTGFLSIRPFRNDLNDCEPLTQTFKNWQRLREDWKAEFSLKLVEIRSEGTSSEGRLYRMQGGASTVNRLINTMQGTIMSESTRKFLP